ncbi:helix-turn-helix domain-containing protein [Trinickia mobilis]|uniref:helix-turn-helix domain-containing protein n=1 Tax=Trinickia mobilis TaxID=2816356 RepID=UPI001A8DAEAC|nr:helix-turn-helix transcriptional regulator [Trinickia mobilis]
MNEKLKPGQAALRSRLSKNLKKIRAAQNISQEELGDRAGLHRTYISQVERMVTNISLDNIYLLSEALSVDPAELLAPVDEDKGMSADHLSGRQKVRRPTA